LQLDALSGGGAAYGEALVAQAAQEVDLAALGDADTIALKAALLEVFGVLADKGAEFGFRSAYEMARFVVIHKQLCGPSWTLADALDAQVLQKLMPRLHGSARKLEKVLADLDAFCVKHALPDSREKIARMQRRLQADGFASFAEN
jgi:5-methylcytosine-specific restriction protein B